MTYSHNDHHINRDSVEDEIRIGKHSDPSKAALADPASRMWLRCDELDDGVDAVFDVSSAQPRMIFDLGEDIL
jgi:hypothetical protein